MEPAYRHWSLPPSSHRPSASAVAGSGSAGRRCKTRPVAAAISVSGLVKTFGTTRALDGLDLVVETGEVHGFLGPNGSGKTTTIRVLLGLLRADRGEVTLLGGDPWRDAVALHRRLAYVPGDVTLWPKLSGGEVIDLLRPAPRRPRPRTPRRAARALRARPDQEGAHLLEGQPAEGRPGRGARIAGRAAHPRRADVGARPADGGRLPGLHPRGQRTEGRTVLLSSHILAEVEALCDRVSIIRSGRTQQSGTLQELRGMTRTSITAELARPGDGLAALPGVHGLEVDGSRVRFDVDTDHLDAAVRRLGELGVRSLVSHPPTLEELFLRHYGDDATHETELADGVRDRRGVTTTDASFTATAPLTRFALRRDRVRIARLGHRDRAARGVDRREREGPVPEPGRARQGCAGVGGQRRRDHLQRAAAGPRHRRRSGRVPDRNLGLDPDGLDERLHARAADARRRGSRAGRAAALAPGRTARAAGRRDDHRRRR